MLVERDEIHAFGDSKDDIGFAISIHVANGDRIDGLDIVIEGAGMPALL